MYTNIRSHCLSCVLHTLYPESVPAPQGCAAGYNNNNNNNELYSVHIHTYIQVADVGMIESGHMAAH